ncbi:cytochrome c peroxidase [Botrimarina sp.]|uniref:cytochrome-c peroxidase n=1 Tax=Botrimarina sp. TaxID=2795802 RepID=UPI0032EF868F
MRAVLLAAVVLCAAPAAARADAPLPESVRLGEGELLTGVRGEGPLTVGQIKAWLAAPENHRVLTPELPVGLDAGAPNLEGLAANPLTRAKIELGRQLYFDTRLSSDGTISCASCHAPEHGWARPERVSAGVRGQLGARNAPTAANRLFSTEQFWDGRADSLEAQAIGPMANPAEMGLSHGVVVDLLREVEGYRLQFESVFGEGVDATGVTIENAGRALAAFERAIVSGPNAWDHRQRLETLEAAVAGEPLDPEYDADLIARLSRLRAAAEADPLPDAARRGAELFYSDRTGCTLCHAGANFTDERYHNLGVGMAPLARLADGEPLPRELERAIDWGRYQVTGDEADRGAFKTPTLRNIAQTAPYMHDGSVDTLEEVVAWYVAGGLEHRYLSPLLTPLDLTDAEQADLVAFLESLTGEWPAVETGRLPE